MSLPVPIQCPKGCQLTSVRRDIKTYCRIFVESPFDQNDLKAFELLLLSDTGKRSGTYFVETKHEALYCGKCRSIIGRHSLRTDSMRYGS